MVKIPELAEDGQNWKIYRAKFLEVAATFDCLEVLAGRPYEGEDWDGCNALLCCTFMESVPPSIYFTSAKQPFLATDVTACGSVHNSVQSVQSS